MAFRNNFQPGEQVLAADVNSMADAIIQSEHNIFELALENYFASKVTPVTGLFFDGFSDTAKRDPASNQLISSALAGQPKIQAPTTGLAINQEVDILDSTNGNFEKKIIQAFSITTLSATFDNFNSLVDGALNGQNGWSGSGNFQVQGTTVFEGLKAVSHGAVNATTDISKSATGQKITRVIYYQRIGTGFFGSTGGAAGLSIRASDGTKLASMGIDPGSGGKFILRGTTGEIVFGVPVENQWFKIEIEINYSTLTARVRVDDGVFTSTVAVGSGLIGEIIRLEFFNNTGIVFWDNISYEASDVPEITFTINLSNAYTTAGFVKRTSCSIETANKRIVISSGLKQGNYRSIKTAFQQSMATVYFWIVRNFSARFNLAAGISIGATTLTITGNETTKFKSGDTIDIYTSTNLLRERKTLTIDSTFAGGFTTLTFSATANAYTTTSFVERIDVLPEVSLVDTGTSESFVSLTYQRSIVDFTNLEVEDEYKLIVTPQEDFIAKLKLSKTSADVSGRTVYAKRLGSVLNT